jgi:hypothetical protein
MEKQFSIGLFDEISMILFWIGMYGIIETILYTDLIYPYKNYAYLLFIMIGLYTKL